MRSGRVVVGRIEADDKVGAVGAVEVVEVVGAVGVASGAVGRGGRGGRVDGVRQAEQCGEPPQREVVGHRGGIESLLHGETGQQGLDQDRQLVGRGARYGPHGRRPPVDARRAVAEGLGVPHPDHVGDLGVADRSQPQFLLEHGPAGRLPVRGVGHVGPDGAELAGGGIGHRHLGEEHGQDRVLPGVEEGEQEALLGTEVGVDGAGGPACSFGHGVDGHGVDALVGEELGGCGEQASPGLRLPFPLRPGHLLRPSPSVSRKQPTYIGSVMQPLGRMRVRTTARYGAPPS